MRKKLLTLGLVSIMMLSLTACGSENSDTANDTATDVYSYESGFEQALEMLTEVTTEVDENADELKDVTVDTVSINYEAMMADDLYMLKPGENFMYSPFSFNMALGMVANGGNDDVMMDASRYFDKSINGYNNFAKYYGLNKPNDLEIANSIWVRDEYEVNSDTNDKLLEYYNSEIYKSYWDSTLVENVNSWCDDKTHGMIPTILSDVPQSSNSILLNAIYFNGAWLDEYTESSVYDDDFTTESGEKIIVPVMHSTENIYYEGDYACAFGKMYDDNRIEFIGILPKEEGDFSLQDLNIEDILKNREDCDVITSIPKFEFGTYMTMDDVLKENGFGSLYEDNSLPDLLDSPSKVDTVIQKTAIKVDEKGTEASAVTVITSKDSAKPVEETIKRVELNRPFAFVIYDTQTNSVLFMGKVMNPSK